MKQAPFQEPASDPKPSMACPTHDANQISAESHASGRVWTLPSGKIVAQTRPWQRPKHDAKPLRHSTQKFRLTEPCLVAMPSLRPRDAITWTRYSAQDRTEDRRHVQRRQPAKWANRHSTHTMANPPKGQPATDSWPSLLYSLHSAS